MLHINGDIVVLGNTLFSYTFALILFILCIIAFWLLQHFMLAWLKSAAERTKTDIDDMLVKIVASFRPGLFFIFSLWIAIKQLSIYGVAETILVAILVLWLVYQAVIITGIVVEDIVFKHLAKEKDPTTKSAIRLVTSLARGIMWTIGGLFVLGMFGVDITSLIAGAGIAGVAVAFALQGILGDLFSSFSIYFDKPFRVGDFIITGDTVGTVDHIGIKSTRIKALSGEMIVLSNQQLASAKIQNFKQMEKRRVVFSFGITYETPHEHVQAVPEMVRKAVEDVEGTRFDRAHFSKFGDSSLDFEVVYHMLDSDYTKYMDAQQAINLSLMQQCAEKNISFAYPTRTIYTKAAE